MNSASLQNIIGRHYEDRLIHSSVHANRDTLYRARIMVLILLISICVEIFMAGILGWWLPPGLFAKLMPLSILALALSCTMLYLLKQHGLVDLCFSLAIFFSLASICFVIVITGGPYYSPARQLLFLPCLLSFLFGGARLGGPTLAVCLVILAALLIVQIAGFDYPQLSSPSLHAYGNMIVLIINFLIASVVAFSYEYTSVLLKRERDLEYQTFIELARKDPLTGLANRGIFDDALQSRIDLYERMPSHPCFVLCYLDLDKFKPINDAFGHDVGDEVLSAVSKRLKAALRGADFVGRQGGDEFMMLFDGVESDASMRALGDRLLQSIREPIATQAGVLSVDGSLGFAAYPRHGRDATNLRNATDAAMYEAKRAGTGYYVYQGPYPGPATT